MVGNWEATIKAWVTPDQPPRETRARATKSWVLGSRFLKEEFEGLVDGKGFNGLGLLGYENVSQRYAAVWLDSNNTSFLHSYGQFDGSGSTLVLLGEYLDPSSRKLQKFRIVYRIVSKALHIFEMYELLGRREELKTLEIVYSRK
jgi:hypothetical protein